MVTKAEKILRDVFCYILIIIGLYYVGYMHTFPEYFIYQDNDSMVFLDYDGGNPILNCNNIKNFDTYYKNGLPIVDIKEKQYLVAKWFRKCEVTNIPIGKKNMYVHKKSKLHSYVINNYWMITSIILLIVFIGDMLDLYKKKGWIYWLYNKLKEK